MGASSNNGYVSAAIESEVRAHWTEEAAYDRANTEQQHQALFSDAVKGSTHLLLQRPRPFHFHRPWPKWQSEIDAERKSLEDWF